MSYNSKKKRKIKRKKLTKVNLINKTRKKQIKIVKRRKLTKVRLNNKTKKKLVRKRPRSKKKLIGGANTAVVTANANANATVGTPIDPPAALLDTKSGKEITLTEIVDLKDLLGKQDSDGAYLKSLNLMEEYYMVFKGKYTETEEGYIISSNLNLTSDNIEQINEKINEKINKKINEKINKKINEKKILKNIGIGPNIQLVNNIKEKKSIKELKIIIKNYNVPQSSWFVDAVNEINKINKVNNEEIKSEQKIINENDFCKNIYRLLLKKSRKVYTLDGDIKVKVKEEAKILGNPEMVIKEVAAEKAAAVAPEAAAAAPEAAPALEAEAEAQTTADGYESDDSDASEYWPLGVEDEDEFAYPQEPGGNGYLNIGPPPEAAPAAAEGAPKVKVEEKCTDTNLHFTKSLTIQKLLQKIMNDVIVEGTAKPDFLFPLFHPRYKVTDWVPYTKNTVYNQNTEQVVSKSELLNTNEQEKEEKRKKIEREKIFDYIFGELQLKPFEDGCEKIKNNPSSKYITSGLIYGRDLLKGIRLILDKIKKVEGENKRGAKEKYKYKWFEIKRNVNNDCDEGTLQLTKKVSFGDGDKRALCYSFEFEFDSEKNKFKLIVKGTKKKIKNETIDKETIEIVIYHDDIIEEPKFKSENDELTFKLKANRFVGRKNIETFVFKNTNEGSNHVKLFKHLLDSLYHLGKIIQGPGSINTFLENSKNKENEKGYIEGVIFQENPSIFLIEFLKNTSIEQLKLEDYIKCYNTETGKNYFKCADSSGVVSQLANQFAVFTESATDAGEVAEGTIRGVAEEHHQDGRVLQLQGIPPGDSITDNPTVPGQPEYAVPGPVPSGPPTQNRHRAAPLPPPWKTGYTENPVVQEAKNLFIIEHFGSKHKKFSIPNINTLITTNYENDKTKLEESIKTMEGNKESVDARTDQLDFLKESDLETKLHTIVNNVFFITFNNNGIYKDKRGNLDILNDLLQYLYKSPNYTVLFEMIDSNMPTLKMFQNKPTVEEQETFKDGFGNFNDDFTTKFVNPYLNQ
jgi:hypothetical protein